MEVTLRFELPEEECEHIMAMKGATYHSVLWKLDQDMRGFLKYGGHHFSSPEEVMEYVRKFINEELDLEEVL